MVWYGMAWHGMAWYVMVWHGMVCYGMVCYGMVWYGTVQYGMVRYCLVLFGVVWCCLVLFGIVWHCLALFGIVHAINRRPWPARNKGIIGNYDRYLSPYSALSVSFGGRLCTRAPGYTGPVKLYTLRERDNLQAVLVTPSPRDASVLKVETHIYIKRLSCRLTPGRALTIRTLIPTSSPARRYRLTTPTDPVRDISRRPSLHRIATHCA
jgi:hypothetical protein